MNALIKKGMLAACLFYPLLLSAQSDIDALRYSQVMFGSTARTLSMGGAFGALGADFGSLSINPAGLGVYRRSEFSMTLGFNSRTTESIFLNNTDNDNSFTIDLPNLSLVLASVNKKQNAEWKQFGFSLGYNRTANFNSESFFEDKNTENSILDTFIEQIQNDGGATELDLQQYYQFGANLAYNTYLINPINPDSTIYAPVITNGGAYQSVSTSTSGGMGEFNLGFGTSYNDKIFFGIGFNFPTLRYEENMNLEEQDKDNEIFYSDTINGSFDFKALKYHQYLLTTGNGFNAKFGIIIKPADWVRIGMAFHTPTSYFMSDSYHSTMSSQFSNGESYQYDSPDGVYSYKLRTPYRAVGSLAFIFGKNGLISFDYEFTDYTSAKLKASDYSFSNENRVINTVYSGYASNYRGGIEWRYEKISFRAGAAYYSTPFKSEYTTSDTDQSVMNYTGGIGYREKKFYFDIGYAYSKRGEFYSPYSLSNEQVPGAIKTRTDHRILTTVGFRF